MTAPFDPSPAAALLADAWRSGRQMSDLPEGIRPRALQEGYDIQDRLIAELGEQVLGWKLGVGSIKGKRDSGIGRSVAGRVLGSRMFRDGDVIALRDRAPVTIEFETAFVLAEEILPGRAPAADPMAVVECARFCCELVRSRFLDRRAVGWPSFAADNSAFDALVVGPPMNFRRFDDAMRSLVVFVDGKEQVRAAQGDDVTEPLAAMRDFFAIANERSMRLPKGAIISSGSMSVPFNVSGAVAIRANCCEAELAFSTTLATGDGVPRRNPS